MHSGVSHFFSLRYVFLSFFSSFFYFNADTSHGSVLIFSFFPFLLFSGFIGGSICLSMVSNSKVRIACPLISFLFARLGGSLGVFPHLENFISEGNSLSVVVADLLPLLRQSIDWFWDLVRKVMSEVRSSELETRLSSSGDPVEGDTAVYNPCEVRAFYAFNEECGLDANTLGRFKDRFQFPEWVRVRLPSKEERACNFFLGEVCFYESSFACGLRFPVHPFLMELLDHFGIAPG